MQEKFGYNKKVRKNYNKEKNSFLLKGKLKQSIRVLLLNLYY